MKKKKAFLAAMMLCCCVLATNAQGKRESKKKWGWGLDVAASMDGDYGRYVLYLGAQRLYSPCKYVTLGFGASVTKTRTDFMEGRMMSTNLCVNEDFNGGHLHLLNDYYLDNKDCAPSVHNLNALGTVMFTLPILKNTGVFCDATGILAIPFNRKVKVVDEAWFEYFGPGYNEVLGEREHIKMSDRVFNKCAPGVFGEFGVYQDFNLTNDRKLRIALGYGYGSYDPLKGYDNASFDGEHLPMQIYNKLQLNRLTAKFLIVY